MNGILPINPAQTQGLTSALANAQKMTGNLAGISVQRAISPTESPMAKGGS